MRKLPPLFLLALVPAALKAQAARPVIEPGNTVLIAQYRCAADQVDRADALMKEVAGPILDKHVKSGQLITWGYTSAYIGDEHTRMIYVWAKDPVALVQARQVYLPEIARAQKFTEFQRVCGAATVMVHNLVTTAGAAGAAR